MQAIAIVLIIYLPLLLFGLRWSWVTYRGDDD